MCTYILYVYDALYVICVHIDLVLCHTEHVRLLRHASTPSHLRVSMHESISRSISQDGGL